MKSPSKMFNIIFWGILLIPQIVYFTIKNFANILSRKDSFYAESLRLFYLRIFDIIKKKSLYPKNTGKIDKFAFILHNLFPIKICYSVMSRPFYILFSNMILISSVLFIVPHPDSWIISLIFLFSSVNYFNQLEKANYQYLGLILSVLATLSYFKLGFSYEFLTLFILSFLFSTSGCILSAISIVIYLLPNFQLLAILKVFILFFTLSLMLIMINLFYISKYTSKFSINKFIFSLTKIFFFIGLFKNKSKYFLKLIRKLNIISGILSTLPFFFIIIYYLFLNRYNYIFIYLFLIFLLFLNQAKLLRLFDFHFIYTWIFIIIILTVEKMNLYLIFIIIFIGTNPIIVYALRSNKNSNFLMGFKLNSPVFLSSNERESILNRISKKLSKRDLYIKPVNNINEYNDIFKKEFLFLEWIWTAACRKNIKYFPDWHSIFLTSNGPKLLNNLFKERKRYTELLELKSFKIKNFNNINTNEIFSHKVINYYYYNKYK